VAGVLSGTPTTAGTYNFTIQVTDSKPNSASASFSQFIEPAPPSAVPAAFAETYAATQGQLQAMQTALAVWTGTKGQIAYGSEGEMSGANRGQSLLNTNPDALVEFEALKSMGCTEITVDVGFPILWQPFYESSYYTPIAGSTGDQDYQNMVAAYQKLVSEAHSRGVAVVAKSQCVLSGFSTTTLNVIGYYSSLTLDQYVAARAQHVALVAQLLQPDFITAGYEPDTEQNSTGQQVNNAAEWTALLSACVTALQGTGLNIPIGGGVGTWLGDSTCTSYVNGLVTIPGLTFIDVHIYPIVEDWLELPITLAGIAAQNGKRFALSEAWLHAETSDGAVTDLDFRAQSCYSFWQPLDNQFLTELVMLANQTQMLFCSPFKDYYFFANLDYDTVQNIQPTPTDDQIDSMESQAAIAAWNNNSPLTNTGAWYATLMNPPPLSLSVPQPPPGTTGNPYTLTLNVSGGVPTYDFTLASGSLPGRLVLSTGGVISGTPTGLGTFAFTAQVTDVLFNTNTAQGTITVSSPFASALVASGFPSPSLAGISGSITVTAQDANGQTVAGYTGTVHFTSSDGQAILPADYTFTTGTSGDNGSHTFNVTLITIGSQSITVTDTATASIAGSQAGITVLPAAVSQLAVSGFPSPVVTGTAGNFTVSAQDAYGNTISNYTGTIVFSSGDTQATLPDNYTFTIGNGGDNGTHSFSATLISAGNQYLAATDLNVGSVIGSQTGIIVTPLLAVSGFPSPANAGSSNSVTVRAQDANGNTFSGYLGTIHFTSDDAKASLPADYPFVAEDNGSYAFNNVILETAGSHFIRATDTSSLSSTGVQTGIAINPAAPNTLLLAGFPSPIMSGIAGNFTVTVLDAYGNLDIGYAGTVSFTSSDEQAELPLAYPFTSGPGDDNGVHIFSATLFSGGTQSISATDTVTATLTGTQSGITVIPPITFLSAPLATPNPADAGDAVSLSSNATGGTGALSYSWTFGDGGSGSGADSTYVYAAAGNFTATVTATDSTGSHKSVTVAVTVNPALAFTTAISATPSQAVVGETISFSAAAAGGTGVLSYSWTFGDGGSGSGAGSTYVYATAGNFTATVTATDSTGSHKSATVAVTVNPALAFTPAISVTPNQAVVGETISFSAAAAGGTGVLSYSWTFGDGGSGSGADSTYVYAAAGNFTATVTATDSTGGHKSATVAVTVNPALAFTTAPSATPSQAGVGETISFSAAATGGTGVLAYAWTFGDGQNGTGASPQHSYASAGNYTATVTVSDQSDRTCSAGVAVTAAAPIVGTGTNSTGTGYSDSFLAATGFVPSQPATASLVQSLTISKIAIKFNFAKAGGDSISMSGTLQIPNGFVANEQKVYLYLGGVMAAFALNAKGASSPGNSQFEVGVKATKGAVKAQTAKYALKMQHGSFAATLAGAGLVQGKSSKPTSTDVTIPAVTLIFNGIILQTDAKLGYKATNKSGAAE
jgi:PKD repeat protein